MENKREFGPDLVRIVAFCLLIWLHFFLRNGFYSSEATGFFGFLAVMFRPVFMCCIPLFLILTGYLHCGKPWSKSYYRSLLPIITSYVIISIIHLFYRIFVLHTHMTVWEWILQFLGFKLAEYGWYIGMYIGLFLLSPLINIMWSSLKTKRQHIAVIATFAAITFLVSTVNSIEFPGTEEINILPAYFTQLYYVTYYLIGCYIRTYRPKANRWICLIITLALAAGQGILNMLGRGTADNYYSGYSASYSNLLIVCMAVSIFLMCYDVECRSDVIRKIAEVISSAVLEMYLMTFIFDSQIYRLHYKEYPMRDYIWVGLLMTACVFVLSFVSGFLISRLSKWICKKRS